MPQSNLAHESQLLRLRSGAREPQLLKPACLEPVLRNKRSHSSEKPAHHNEEQPPLAATRESLHAATKTQRSQKWINKINLFKKRDNIDHWDFFTKKKNFAWNERQILYFYHWISGKIHTHTQTMRDLPIYSGSKFRPQSF